ncbi:MAG: hypothetical protein JOZ46_06365, partial [Candidatus Dormibacteraeota bacterium]|nr:hypothetical protein [Candidatus Dormibacteraeota bacterium]
MIGGGHRWAGRLGGPGDRPSGRVPRSRLVRDVAQLFRPYRVAVAGIVVLVL